MKLYFRPGCTSSTKAIKWVKANSIPLKTTNISQITRKNLIYTLSNIDRGFEELLKNKDQVSLESRGKFAFFE